MNQKFGNVIISAAVAVFWYVVAETIIALIGKTATPWGWLPIGVMVVTFLISLFGLSWVTSETR